MVYATYKQSSTETEQFTLTDADGRAADLTGDTVYITLYFTGTDAQDPGVVTGVNDTQADTVVSAETGTVEHTFESDDVSEPGRYEVYFRVNDGSSDTYYPKQSGYYTIDVESRPDATSAGVIDQTTTLSQTLDAAGNDITNVGILNLNDVTNASPVDGDLWHNGSDIFFDPDGNGGQSLLSSGGSGSAVDVYGESGAVTLDADLMRFLDDSDVLDVTVTNPSSGEANISYRVQDGTIDSVHLAFDPATQTELNTHIATADAHHTKYTDENAQDAVGTILSSAFAYDDPGNAIDIATGGITTQEILDATVTTDDIDGSGGSFGEVIQTDGTQGGVTWGSVSGSSVWSDTTTDNADGGDRYRLPNAEDSWDGQGSQEAENLEYVGGATGAFNQIEDRPSGDTVSTDALIQDVVSATSATTAAKADVVLGDASGGAFDVTLPSPSTDVNVTIKKTDSSGNAVGIVTPGGETIDGQSSIDITQQNATRTIVSDGTDYFLI